MLTLADVIFPAFFLPYLFELTPAAGIAVLATEAVVYRYFNRATSWPRIISIVISANVLSSLIGIFIAAALPTGLDDSSRSGYSAIWQHYLVLSWVLAFALSIVIEYAFVRLVWRRSLQRIGITVVIANVASYAVLLAIVAVHGMT